MSRANPRYRRTNLPLPAPVNNVYEVILYGMIEGQITINTFYYTDARAVGVFGPAPESELSAKLQANVPTTLAACQTIDTTQTGSKVQCITSVLRAPVINTYTSPVPGTVANPHEPTQMGCVMIRRTPYKGQSGRGRITIAGVPQTFVTSSTLTAGARTAYNAFSAVMLGTLATTNETFTPCMVSRRGKAPTISIGSSTLTTMLPNSLLGTIRRRKVGKGK